MAKRTIEHVEAEAATATAELISKKKKKDRSEKKLKSKKLPDAAPEALAGEAVPAAEDEANGVDEEKKKKKKEKKEKKDKKKKVKGVKESGSALVAMDVDEPETPAEEPKPSKEERKAARKAAKEAKKAVARNGSPASDETPEAVPADKYNGAIGDPTSTSGYTESLELTNLPKITVDGYLNKHAISTSDPHKSNLRPITSFSYLPAHTFDFSAFTAPTPIQAATWPYTLSGYDCIGVAETGSGKTLAFSVPAIRHIASLKKSSKGSSGVKVVVVSPTRELAMQIYETMEKFSKAAKLTAVCIYGGVPKDEQRQKLKRADIIVATPGRLQDLIDEGCADLSKVSYLVLDEADRMLDKGFEDAIRRILSVTPTASRQTLMFTATWPTSVRELAATFMKTPVKITIGDRDDLRANIRIKQTIEVIDQRAKEQRLLSLLRQHQSGAQKDDRILVFCLYKKEATRVEMFLRSQGCRVAGIHGDLSQAQRTQALGQFKDGSCPLLIATDVAARGLDIPKVKLVINVTFPLTIEDYVHRIGRTGRAGADGMAYTFFTEHDKVCGVQPSDIVLYDFVFLCTVANRAQSHSGALVNVLKAAGQPVPESLLKFGTTVKKKEHSAYGAFYKETDG